MIGFLKCLFGFHCWCYERPEYRYCRRCGAGEVLVSFGWLRIPEKKKGVES